MKQTSGFISTYSADAFGVCSALYELGGMIVMHDASGCNSTYTTHDEPRWYDMDSMVYISGLTEIEAIMGDDSKLINDISEAALELKPRFIAIVGTTIPAMTGFDAAAAAREIEDRTGIPAFGFSTTGMRSYIHGAGMAFNALAEHIIKMNPGIAEKNSELVFCKDDSSANDKGCSAETGKENASGMNIIGLTPLDFSINGSAGSIKEFYEKKGYRIVSSWAMGSSPEEIENAGTAGVNQVVSASGILAASAMRDKLGIPYKIGIPIGNEEIDVTEECGLLKDYKGGCLFKGEKGIGISMGENAVAEYKNIHGDSIDVLILGECVSSFSLAKFISKKTGKSCAAFSATEMYEDEIRELICDLNELRFIIADPLYRGIFKLLPKELEESISFISLPHEAFSGRMYRNDIPDLVRGGKWISDMLEKLR